MNCSTPGLPAHHQLPEFTQTHVHRVDDAIQPFHPVILFSCPQSLPASGSFPMSQIFTWGGQSIGVLASASLLPINIQDWSPLEWTGWISLQSKGLSRVFSNTTVQNHQFFGTQLSFSVRSWNLAYAFCKVSPECTRMRTPIAHSWGKKGSMKCIRFSTSLGRERIEKLIWIKIIQGICTTSSLPQTG